MLDAHVETSAKHTEKDKRKVDGWNSVAVWLASADSPAVYTKEKNVRKCKKFGCRNSV